MDAKILALEATRDLTRTWLHVDMDAFFACEHTCLTADLPLSEHGTCLDTHQAQ